MCLPALAHVLVDRFNDTVVSEQLIRAAWPRGNQEAERSGHSRFRALRSRLGWLSFESLGSCTKGYTMRVHGGATDLEGCQRFKDELEAARLLRHRHRR
jgi:hypothetical protein